MCRALPFFLTPYYISVYTPTEPSIPICHYITFHIHIYPYMAPYSPPRLQTLSIPIFWGAWAVNVKAHSPPPQLSTHFPFNKIFPIGIPGQEHLVLGVGAFNYFFPICIPDPEDLVLGVGGVNNRGRRRSLLGGSP